MSNNGSDSGGPPKEGLADDLAPPTTYLNPQNTDDESSVPLPTAAAQDGTAELTSSLHQDHDEVPGCMASDSETNHDSQPIITDADFATTKHLSAVQVPKPKQRQRYLAAKRKNLVAAGTATRTATIKRGLRGKHKPAKRKNLAAAGTATRTATIKRGLRGKHKPTAVASRAPELCEEVLTLPDDVLREITDDLRKASSKEADELCHEKSTNKKQKLHAIAEAQLAETTTSSREPRPDQLVGAFGARPTDGAIELRPDQLVGAFGARPTDGAIELRPAGLARSAESGSSSSNGENSSATHPRDAGPSSLEEGESFNLVEARMISEENIDNIPRAEEMRPKSDPEKRQRVVRAAMLATVISVMLLVGMTLLLVFLLQVKGNAENTLDKEKLPPETGPPIPTEKYVLSLLPSYTLAAIEDADSPQFQAFDWLLHDPNLTTYPDWRMIQRFALATFYFATSIGGGESWVNKDYWLDYYQHECAWEAFSYHDAAAILETASLPRIIGMEFELDLIRTKTLEAEVEHDDPCEDGDLYKHLWQFMNNLDGSLPPELFLLTSLRTIFLANNKGVRGPIPTQIGQVTSLEAFGITPAEISGQLPTEFGLLENIIALGLMYNNLSGTLPSELGKLSKLMYIGLDTNRISGTIPSELGQLKAMLWTSLFANALTGTIPTEMSLMTSSLVLDLMGNELVGPIPTTLAQLTRLKQIWLNGNSLSGQIPPQLSKLPHLELLRLEENQLIGTIPDTLCALSVLDFDCGDHLCGCGRCTCSI